MNKTQRRRLGSAGWRVGGAKDFLKLNPEQAALVELKLALADYFRDVRAERGWTQTYVAKKLRSSQSRIAKIEAGDPSVSLDLLVRCLLTLGVSTKEVGRAIARVA